MTKIKKVVLYSLLVLMIIIFAFSMLMYKLENDESGELYIINNIGEVVTYESAVNYNGLYSDNIILEMVNQIEYSLEYGDDVLYGKVYIAEDSKLYISDDIREKEKIVLNEEIVTLYDADIYETNKFLVYAISKKGNVYKLSMPYPDISNVEIVRYTFSSKIINFTTLKLNLFPIIILYSHQKKVSR